VTVNDIVDETANSFLHHAGLALPWLCNRNGDGYGQCIYSSDLVFSAFSWMKLLTGDWILIALQQFWVVIHRYLTWISEPVVKHYVEQCDGCLDSALAELEHGHFTSLHFRDLVSSAGVSLWQQLSCFHCSIRFFVSETFVFCWLFQLFIAIWSHALPVYHPTFCVSVCFNPLNPEFSGDSYYNPGLPQKFASTVLKSNIPHQNIRVVLCDDKLIMRLLYATTQSSSTVFELVIQDLQTLIS